MVNLPISSKLAQQLETLARRDGLTLEAYLERLVQPNLESANGNTAHQNPEFRFFDFAFDMLCVADVNGYFTRVNRVFCETLGYTAEELSSRPYIEFVHPDDRSSTHRVENDLYSGSLIRGFENRYRHKNGDYIWLSWNSTAADENGFIYAVARESTHRKEQERQLLYETEQIRSILERVTDGFCAVDAQGNIVYLNDSAIKMLNIETDGDNVIGKPSRQVISQFGNPIFLKHYNRACAYNRAENFIIFETETSMWIEVNIYPSDSGVSIYLRNITNEYTTEAQLRESESQFRGLFENALDAILIVDDHGRIVRANPAAHDLYGYPPRAMNGKHLKDIYHYNEQVQKHFNAIWQDFLQKGAIGGQITIQRPDGVIRLADFQSKAYISTNRHISTLRDVTEREEALLQMQQGEEKFRQLTENANEVFWLGDLETDELLYVSPAFRIIWGVDVPPLPEITQAYLVSFIYPDDLEMMRDRIYSMAKIVSSGEEYFSEYRIVRPDGDIRWIRSRFAGVRDDSGVIYRYAGISTDITPTKIMEQALLDAVGSLEERVEQRTQELTQTNLKLQQQVKARRAAQRERERLATILEVTSDFVGIFNADMRLNFLNNAGRKMIGIDEIDPVDNIVFWDLYPDWIHTIVRDMVESSNHLGIASGEATFIGPNNQELPVSQVIISRRSEQGAVEFYAVVCRDISEAKRTEDSLLQRIASEKELNEFKSRYVAMLSHEFRIPLQAIMNSSSMVKNYSERLSAERKNYFLTRIEKNIKQMNTLIEIIMGVGTSNEVQLDFKPEKLDFVQLCKDVIDEVSFAENHSHVIEYAPEECPLIEADPTLIYQAVSNLLTNAMKYSPEGSTIHFDLWPDGRNIVFSVKDIGIGIPESDLPTMFEVFQRASNVGRIQGKGLGLAVVKFIIDAHSGWIKVDSKVNKGTVFTVHIPISQESSNEDTREIEI